MRVPSWMIAEVVASPVIASPCLAKDKVVRTKRVLPVVEEVPELWSSTSLAGII